MPKAKKKSADPVQQALRDHKAEWKESQKDFIAQVQGLKNGLNGRGDSRFGIPPSNIKDPLPGEVGALLGALSSQFQALVGGASSIISEQNSYSSNRRKKQEKKLQQKKPASPAQQADQPPTQAVEPAKDTAVDSFLGNVAMSEEDFITKYGSNRLSRGLQYMLALKSRDEETKKRTGLLSATADIYKEFLDLENMILSAKMESIPESIVQFQLIYGNLESLKDSLMEGQSVKPGSNTSTPGSDQPGPGAGPGPNRRPESDKEKFQELQNNPPPASKKSKLPPKQIIDTVLLNLRKDMTLIIQSSLPFKQEAKNINKLITEFARAQENGKEDLVADILNQIERDSRALKMAVSTNVQNEPNPNKRKAIEDMLAKDGITSSADWSAAGMTKLSHMRLTRYLKRKLLGLRSSNKTVYHRLKIANSVDSIKKTLQVMMDSLEGKNIDTKGLMEHLGLLSTSCQEIKEKLTILNRMYEAYRHKHSRNKKTKMPSDHIMDTLYQNELRRNIKRNIF